MTSSNIERLRFTPRDVKAWEKLNPRHSNWPVVYTINDDHSIYVGETLNASSRMHQHLQTAAKVGLERVQVILDDTFNKSACLDLESSLIRWFSGDGHYQVLNANAGITEADYYDRDVYRQRFADIFNDLWATGYFTKSLPAIENSDLFKLSPFKALTQDQAAAVESIVDGLFSDLENNLGSTSVVRGDPGTGKTIVAIFLMKLLGDIRDATDDVSVDGSIFADYFTAGHRDLLQGFRLGLVVPQQSLRESIKQVFRKTPGLGPEMVLTPFEVAEDTEPFDLLIVDEAHRLSQLAAQAFGTITRRFMDVSHELFGDDYQDKTQLDWIRARSSHQIFLLDLFQRIRPADAPQAAFASLLRTAHVYPLATQMRVKAGSDYVGYVRDVLHGLSPPPQDFGDYDLRFFDDFDLLHDQIVANDEAEGLSRLVAGYAWPWVSRKNKSVPDIVLGSHGLPWNRTATDWVNSPGSLHEVGSIHTIQGYDLNYAGVIIGNDLRYDPATKRLWFDRKSYFDARGKANNKMLGISYSDDDLLALIQNIYAVLLTRGIRGTYVYVCDPDLREYLRGFFSPTM